ncbi:MAG: protochlorophyllide oxidoreductase, partial [Pseudonocardiaceae bacterium]
MSGWSAVDVADQAGRTVLVTGASSGLGLQTAAVLAGHGAMVLMG